MSWLQAPQSPELVLVAGSLLLILAVFAGKVSDRFGIPALLLFLGIGMLAGVDGVGKVAFDDAALAQFLGVIALALILFSGGLATDLAEVRPVLRAGLALSTLGVLITAGLVGVCAHYVAHFNWVTSLLLGAVVSPTDAAAVFSVLRARQVGLRGKLQSLLEFESGSNDPMAVVLTVALIQIATAPAAALGPLLWQCVLQMGLGLLFGYGMGRAIVWLVNQLRLWSEGLYPVLTIGLALFTYAASDLLGGNGFLAVYIAGLVAGQYEFLHKRSLLRFHDGVGWLMQIVMFLTLGLLVYPSQLVGVAGTGLVLTAFLMFVARPVAVFLVLAPARLSLREMAIIAWVGLRGAAPIVLATFPLLAGVPQANFMFHLVFFVVLVSVLLQGTTMPLVARWLQVTAPIAPKHENPLEYNPVRGLKSVFKEVIIGPASPAVGRTVVDLKLPSGFLIVLIGRENTFIVPRGATVIEPWDLLLVIAEREVLEEVQASFAEPPEGAAAAGSAR